jgi:hypothetical protein
MQSISDNHIPNDFHDSSVFLADEAARNDVDGRAEELAFYCLVDDPYRFTGGIVGGRVRNRTQRGA